MDDKLYQEKHQEWLNAYAELQHGELACQKVGVGHTTFYRWTLNYPEFKKAYEDLKPLTKDGKLAELELKLHQLSKGDLDLTRAQTSALIFALKSLDPAKYAGLDQKQHQITINNKPIKLEVQIKDSDGKKPFREVKKKDA